MVSLSHNGVNYHKHHSYKHQMPLLSHQLLSLILSLLLSSLSVTLWPMSSAFLSLYMLYYYLSLFISLYVNSQKLDFLFPWTSHLPLPVAPVPAKQPWWIWINTSCEFIMNDCITTTKQSTTKPCAYFLGFTVVMPYGVMDIGQHGSR